MQNKRSTKTNRILSLMMALIMTLGILPVMTITARAAGGTPDITWHNTTAISFTISTADQLAGLAQLVNGGTDFTGKTIKLTTDINLYEYTDWTPIGTNNITPFTGTFNGDGYVINNLIINSTAAYVGLFGYIGSGGEVMNLGIASGTVSSTSSSTVNVGGLAGQNYGTITNCYNRSTVSGTGTGTGQDTIKVGGLTGGNGGKDGTAQINNSYNSGTVSVTSSSTITVGGLTGGNGEFSSTTTAQINNSYNSGTVSVTGTSNSMISVGGVSGANVSTAQINNSYNSGTVSVTGTGNGTYIGGVSGVNNITAQINNCYNSGMVSSTVRNSDVGGVVGMNNNSTITNSYNSGNIMGTFTDGITYTFVNVGGLVGTINSGTITNCYNSGTVDGTGTGTGTITVKVGGLVGQNYGAVSNCYYDKDKIPLPITAVGGGTQSGTDLSTASMIDVNVLTDIDKMSGLGTTYWVKSDYSTTNGCATSFYPELKVFAEDGTAFDKAMSKISVIATVNPPCGIIGTDEQYFVDGNGTSGDPYQISTPQQLNHVRKHMTTVEHFKMMNDINLSAYTNWSPIGTLPTTNQFEGTFDGGGHVITNLTINSSNLYVGLFGYNTGTIQNLGIASGTVKGTVSSKVGGLVGSNSGGTITNSYNSGMVTGNGNIGGLVGDNTSGKITNCYNSGTVTGIGGSSKVGGLVGTNSGGTIENCYNSGEVTGSSYVGGLVGNNASTDTITDCYYDKNKYNGDAIGDGTSASDSNGLTTADMVMSNVLTSGKMSGLVPTSPPPDVWVKRTITATDDYCYYPELSVFFSGAAEASSKLSTQVQRIPVAIITPPTASPINQGQQLSTSTLTGGSASVNGIFAWKDGTITPPVTGNYDAIFTPESTNELYKPTTISVSVTVNATQPPTPPVPPTPPINPNTPFVPTYNPPLNNGTNNSLGDSSNNDSSSNDGTDSNPPAVDNTITVTTESGITITFTYVYTPTGGIVLTASVAAILKVANSSDDSAILCIPLPSGKYIEICFDNIALEAIAKQAGKLGNITITIEIVDNAKLSRKDRQFVGDNLVFEFIIMGVRKGERITDLKGGTMTATFSRGLTSGENNHDRTIFYRDSSGKVQKSKAGKYHERKNGVNNVVSFTFTEL